MEFTFSKEDIDIVEKFIKIKNSGYYCSGAEVTNAYNRILHKNVNTTNCGSCIRGRIQELENALNVFKAKIKAQEALKEAEVNNSPLDKNNTTGEAENKSVEKKRPGRPKKI